MSDSSVNWKHVAVGTAGVLVIGVGAYGVYSYYLKKPSSGGNSSEGKVKSALERAIDEKNKGNKYFKGREYQKAIKCYNNALQLCPSDSSQSQERATFHHNLAAAHEKLKDHEMVIKECTNCLSINNKYVKALSKRARALEALKRLEEALTDITAAAVLEEMRNQDNLQLSESITRKLSEEKAKETYASRHQFGKAPNPPSEHFIKCYFDSFTFDIFSTPQADEKGDGDSQSDSSKPGFLRAKKYFSEGRYSEIEDECSAEISEGATSPYYIPSLLVRATFRLLQGSAKGAIEDLEAVISSDVATPLQKSNAYIKRGSLHMQTQDNMKAMQDFEDSVKCASDSVDAYHHRGQLFLLMEDIPRCCEEFRRCCKLAPDFDQPAVQLCYANYKAALMDRDVHRVNSAMADFKHTLARFPKSADGHAMYAQTLADQNQASDALEQFDRAIQLDPHNAANYVHKGMLLLQLKGDYNTAVQLINQGIHMDPKSDFAYEMLGTIEIKRGDYTAAARAFQQAIEIARFEIEMSRLYFLYYSAVAWKAVRDTYGIDVTSVLGKLMGGM